MLKTTFHVAVAWIFAGLLFAAAYAVEPGAHPRLQVIFDELVEDNVYSADELRSILAQAEVQQSILDAMQSPAEYKFTWGKYRKLFLQEDRIQQGVDFWAQYSSELKRAESEYGVPASVIVAIIGVESKFGKYKGKHKVLDSLVTLVVGFERRSKFFASELKEFLILAKENQLDATQVLGSYAGAVGFPQFISSSYRHYAVDFNGDGITDLIDQPVDAIGSVANYFVENGWRPGAPVSSAPFSSVAPAVAELASRKRKAQHSAQQLRGLGAPVATNVPDTEQLGVLMLNANENVPEERERSIYMVRAGDTACQIAERHNVSCASLFKLNKLNSKGDIFRGQRLKLPAEALQPVPVSDDTKWKVSGAAQVANENAQAVSTEEQPQYFFTHHNFYVITRYNQSVLYAMAVHDLSSAIAAAHQQRGVLE